MRISIYILLFSLFLGCEQVSFREPQPRNKKSLPEIPESLTGRYLMEEKPFEFSRDTIIVGRDGFRIGYFDAEEREKNKNEVLYPGGLRDSLILKSYKGYYFLNFQEKPEWILRVLRKEKNGDITLMSMEQHGVTFEDYLKKLAAVIKVDSATVNGEKLYQIDPSPAELFKLIKDGFFSETRLKKVD